MGRFACIHGHFYQPPRENPWLEAVERQDSAYPYHDWNRRVSAECYAPNSASRLLDGEGRIVDIVNNYELISFDFGPTLLSWLQEQEPELYEAVIAGEARSRERFSGHGSALAQAYHHSILPLADERDRRTEVIWGIEDFRARFGRDPEGMWLPETAVDLPTLECLAEHDIRFTVLAPGQARRVSRAGDENEESGEGSEDVDPRRPYRLSLPSGADIALFFYDGRVSHAVAFDGALRSGEDFLHRLREAFSEDDEDQLVHIATDGETYGHHHHHGDMALAYVLDRLVAYGEVRLTNYAEYLAGHPPEWEAEIHENSSWSCAHGVERWRSDCGCTSGSHEWHQRWRRPLREALDWLRDELHGLFELEAGSLLGDPWQARDRYIGVILDRSPESTDRYFADLGRPDLSEADKVRALQFLEMQRNALRMYTSCGWFFDEISSLGTVQILGYAARAMQLARELSANDLEPGFLDRLEAAESNLPEYGNGRRVYEERVRTAAVDLLDVAAHDAVASLFEEHGERAPVYCYRVERQDYGIERKGNRSAAAGRVRVVSDLTREEAVVSFAVLHFGDHNLHGGVGAERDAEADRQLRERLFSALSGEDLAAAVRSIDEVFGDRSFSLHRLFRDEQRRIVTQLLAPRLEQAERRYRELFRWDDPLVDFVGHLGMSLPGTLRPAAEFLLNTDLQEALQSEPLEVQPARELLGIARSLELELDGAGLGYVARQRLESLMQEAAASPRDEPLLRRLDELLELVGELPFEVDLWKAQNVFFSLRDAELPAEGTEEGHPSGDWSDLFRSVGRRLSVKMD